MFDITQPPARLADPVHIGLQPRLAVRQRQFAQILAALEQQVEGDGGSLRVERGGGVGQAGHDASP